MDAIQVSGKAGRAGAAREFDDFVESCSTRLLRTAYLLTHDRGRAEDLLQTALVKAWLSWSRIEGDPTAYVKKTLVNTYATWWRRKWNDERPTPELPDAEYYEDRATTHDLWAALGRLPGRQRAVIVLRYVEDLSVLSGRWIGYQLGPEFPLEGEHTLRLWLTKGSSGEKAAPPDGQIGAAVYRLPEPAATVAGHQVQELEADGGSEFRMVRHEESEPGTRELSSTYPAGDIPVGVDWYTSGSGSPNVQVYVDGRPETSLPLGEGGPGLVLAPAEAHSVRLQILGDVPPDALLGLVWREQR